jgi:hypothetical protein
MDLRRCAVTGPSGVRAAQWAALIVGGLALALTVAEVPLAGLARQSVLASGGSLPFPFTLAYGVAGVLVAWRKPGNVVGWLMLGGAAFGAASESASFYMVADYRLHGVGQHGGHLPLGWLAVLAQPGWAPCIVALGLIVLLFPDGRLPGPRWRWYVGVYLAVGAVWLSGAYLLSVGAILSHHIQVDSGGNLLVLEGLSSDAAWWDLVQNLFMPVLLVSWLAAVAGQVASYRRSSGERRQQLKWLLAGTVGGVGGLFLAFGESGTHGLVGTVLALVSWLGLLALPACIGVAILKYRLLDIDRLISRTLAYALLTGLLLGVYAGLVLLATEALRLSSSVAVAVATLAAAGLFYPLRARVQRAVDRRFNRARYDADAAVAAFAARLQDAVDLDKVRADLHAVVSGALQPDQLWVYVHDAGAATGAER